MLRHRNAKLKLSKVTLRSLMQSELKRVQGGWTELCESGTPGVCGIESNGVIVCGDPQGSE